MPCATYLILAPINANKGENNDILQIYKQSCIYLARDDSLREYIKVSEPPE